MPRFVVVLILSASALIAANPADPGDLPRTKPLSPAASLAAMQVRPGFHVELVASEPLIRDPVAIDFDEDGNLYVAEFPEYNQYVNPGFDQLGCVKKLTDTDGDGKYDQATIYAEFDSPVAVACWDGGVFVGVVPDLWYVKDTDGDGKADIKKKVLTGFDRDRAGEGMLNSFHWSLDNRFVISTSLAGGSLKPADDPNAKPISVRRQNIRFDPRSGQFEPTSGGGQHGMTLDDWGDAFVCGNSNPIQHLVYDGRYLLRNPYVEAPSPVIDVNAAGRYPNLHRISPTEPWREARTRLRAAKLVPGSDEGGKPFGFFTGATGVTVFRGDAWPAEFHGNIFVGEIANNLIYRAIPKPKGLTWSAERAETGREFLASTDIWFRPVQFANGPDGNLYVVDMYRELIEGAAFLPPDLLKYVDVAGGVDRGRIWRIVADGTQRRPPPKLSKATTAELVGMLEHPNGWHRDTASRLLYQRQDGAAIEPLRKLANGSEIPLARTQARYALAGLNHLTAKDVAGWLHDPDPHGREHALRLAEPFLEQKEVMAAVSPLISDPDLRVRFQAVFTLGSAPNPAKELASIVKTNPDSHFPFAVLVSAHRCGGELFDQLLGDASFRATPNGQKFLLALAVQVAAANKPGDLATVMTAINTLSLAERSLLRALMLTLVAKASPSNRAKLTTLAGPQASAVLAEALTAARRTAADEKAAPAARIAAIRTLTLTPFAEAEPVLKACLDFRQPPPVQTAALEALGRYSDSAVSRMILTAWPAMTPTIRANATEVLFCRPAWVADFLDAVERTTIRRTDIDPARLQVLLASTTPGLRSRAQELFAGSTLSKRADVIAKYQPALQSAGDAGKGKLIFKNVCSACHKLEGVGTAVGPDLASIKNRGTDAVLTNVLDPNREVQPQYFTYLITTDDGATITGLITAETANTVTLRKADGTTVSVQRVSIEAMRSTGLSAMPEGIEQQLPIPAMADLLAYLSSIKN